MFRPRSRTGPLLALALLTACQAQDKLGPSLPTAPTDLSRYAYYLQIDLEQGTIAVTPPARPSPGTGTTAGLRPAFSLMGSDIIALTTSNFTRSAVGAVVPNKRTITFDLAITNRLSVSDLVTPTFPQPPAGIQGLIAFPYTVAPAGTQGGKAVPDNNWDGDGSPGSGAPTNLFNDFATCPTGAQSDCYRWELFPAPLAPGATTAPRKVGFTVGAGVTSVGVYLVVAADLLDHPPPPPAPGKGAITGSVNSSLGGGIAGAVVTVTPGTSTATTDAIGGYVVTGIPVGAVTVAVSGLPANCVAPATAPATVTSGGVATVDFLVACTPASGTVTGRVEILNVQAGGGVAAEPLAFEQMTLGGMPGQTDATGFYQISGVPAGSYSLTAANFPGLSNCSMASPVSVTVGPGQVVAPTVTFTCFQALIVRALDAQDGTPLPGISVTVAGNGTTYSGPTNQAGEYLTGTLQTGYYTVAIGAGNGCTVSGPASPVLVRGGPGQLAAYTINCFPFSGTINGQAAGLLTIDLPGFGPESTSVVQVTDGNGQVVSTTGIDASGQYSAWIPGPGTYSVQAVGRPAAPVFGQMGCGSTAATVIVPPPGGGIAPGPTLTVSCTGGAVLGEVTATGFDPHGTFAAATVPQNPNQLVAGGTLFDVAGTATFLIALPANQQVALYIRSAPNGSTYLCTPQGPQLSVVPGQVARVDLSCQ